MQFLQITGSDRNRRASFTAEPAEVELSLFGHTIKTAHNPNHTVQHLSEVFGAQRNDVFYLPAARELILGHVLVADSISTIHGRIDQQTDRKIEMPQIVIDALVYIVDADEAIKNAMLALDEVHPKLTGGFDS